MMGFVIGSETKRDRQQGVGPSEIGGCSRRVWERLQGNPVVNRETLRLAARMGTAIHKEIEYEVALTDPFEERFLREVEVEGHGLVGHVDLYDKRDREVVDWKTTTKKNLSYFPSEQQLMQVHVYGELLTLNGYSVDTVTLVVIARDGNETDVRRHSEPWDRDLALQGIAWLDALRTTTEAPAPEKHPRFCKDYCSFYDRSGEHGCEGKS